MSNKKQSGLHIDPPNIDSLAEKYDIPCNSIDGAIKSAQKSMRPYAMSWI